MNELKKIITLTLMLCITLAFAQNKDFKTQEKNSRGSTTGETKANGYSHPNQFMHIKPTLIADNMEPVILHEKDR